MSKVFKLEIDMSNAAFQDDYGPGDEVSRILKELAERCDGIGFLLPLSLYDINGAKVGSVNIIERKAKKS
jgi:hypothetical protein